MTQSNNNINDEDFHVDKLLTALQGHSLQLGKTVKSHRKADEKEKIQGYQETKLVFFGGQPHLTRSSCS